MASIIPVSTRRQEKAIVPQKSMASSKRWISDQFYQALNRHMGVNDDGEDVTYAQKMIEGVVEMATDDERDDYVRLAATKFIIEHMEGKASTMKEESHEEMPQIVINVKNMNMNNIQNVSQVSNPVPQNDVIAEMEAEYAEVDDGECN